MSEPSKPTGPDLAQGIPLDDLADGGMIGGHVGEEPVLLARRGDEFFAIGRPARTTAARSPGIRGRRHLRCPWHHARFSLRTGEAIGAPALDPVACWRVEKRDGEACVREKIEPSARRSAAARSASGNAERVVIVGGGARRIRGRRDAPARGLRRQRHAAVTPTTPLPTTGRTARRTISPATRRKNGSR